MEPDKSQELALAVFCLLMSIFYCYAFHRCHLQHEGKKQNRKRNLWVNFFSFPYSTELNDFCTRS